jgi:hypothetical protein
MDRYGCHNRPPLAASFVAQDGYRMVRDGYGQPSQVPVYKDIQHHLSTDCRYVPPRGIPDPKCDGCRWRIAP